jgi:hypothetical protein
MHGSINIKIEVLYELGKICYSTLREQTGASTHLHTLPKGFFIKGNFRCYLAKRHIVTSEYLYVWKVLTFVEIHVSKIEHYAPLNRHEQSRRIISSRCAVMASFVCQVNGRLPHTFLFIFHNAGPIVFHKLQ